MKKKIVNRIVSPASMLYLATTLNAQSVSEKNRTIVAWEGMTVVGYVDHGAFVNFGGPTVKFIKKPYSIGFGILPTMRIKEDPASKTSPNNSIITPTAGFGFTLAYKHLVLQVPFYYNPKTSTIDGKWKPGIGLGTRF
jgi:hypothetical protein